MSNKSTKKNRIVLFLIFVSFLLIANPAKAVEIGEGDKWTDYDNYTVIDHDTTWSGHMVFNDPYKPVIVVNGATLTIEKGAVIEILTLEVYMGRIVAEGSQDSKITFTKATPVFSNNPNMNPNCGEGDRGMFYFDEISWNYEYGTEASILRYVTFKDMGSYDFIDQEECRCQNCSAFNFRDFFFKTAYAQVWPDRKSPVIKFESGRLHIENSSFENNYDMDVSVDASYDDWSPASRLEIVNSNFSGNKQGIAVDSRAYKYLGYGETASTNYIVFLKDNWYGDESGPRVAPDYSGDGEIIKGNYTLNSWRKNDSIVDPAIIIPGITGSMPSKVSVGKMELDPVLRIYENLVASFIKNGYEKEKNLFEFPYEWRNSNVLSAEELKNKISEIRTKTGISKVDIVAHSMGGLLTRQYIENVGFQNDIDQFITLGTPHKGSPEAYLKWEAAEGFEDPLDKVARSLFALEAHSLGYDSLKDYIQNRVVSVRELLPDYSYLKKASNGEMKDYFDGYPRNDFLENLNSQTNLQKLSNVSFVNIVGKTDDDDTIGKFRVVNSTVSGSWEHGMPENYYDSSTDQGIEYTTGDETVPLTSANGIAADKKIEIDSVHGDLPTKAQCEVIKELTGKNSCQYVSTFDRAKDILFFGVFSPIDIQVVAPDGKRMGKNFASGEEYNEIPGAYYSGFNTDNEFLTIPNPIDGEYKILTQGTGDGEYKVETTKISEDENDPTKVTESKVEISGTATKDSNEELTVEIAGTQVLTEDKDETPPVVNIISPESKAYQNNKILDIKYEISDDVSESEKIGKEIFFDGNPITDDKIDLSLEHLGNHNISITATDEAGNTQEAKTEFSNETNVDSIISNVSHYFNLHLITNLGTKNYLQAKLRLIKVELRAIESLQKSKMNKNLKNKMTEIAKKTTNLQIDLLIKQLEKERNFSKTIDAKIKDLLVESLESIRI